MKATWNIPRLAPSQAVAQALAQAVSIAVAAAALSCPAGALAQSPGRIFRCGNTYTNDPTLGQGPGCHPVESGRVTVVEGTRVQAPPSPPSQLANLSPPGGAPGLNASGAGGARVESREQQARDAQAREILEEELRRAQARQAELLREYNNGEPEKLGPETRNHQKYLDRIEQLKASIARNEADIQGIRRELARLGASK